MDYSAAADAREVFGIKMKKPKIRNLHAAWKRTTRGVTGKDLTEMRRLFWFLCQYYYPAPTGVNDKNAKKESAGTLSRKEVSIRGEIRSRGVVRYDIDFRIEGDPRRPYDMEMVLIKNKEEYARYYFYEAEWWRIMEYEPYEITRDKSKVKGKKGVYEGTEFSDLNPYEVLGLEQGASQKEIKRAYLKMALKWHPDKNKSKKATLMMKKINWAYQVLIDKENKYDYMGDWDWVNTEPYEDPPQEWPRYTPDIITPGVMSILSAQVKRDNKVHVTFKFLYADAVNHDETEIFGDIILNWEVHHHIRLDKNRYFTSTEEHHLTYIWDTDADYWYKYDLRDILKWDYWRY